MKISDTAKEKYAWYLSLCREDEPRPLLSERIELDTNGVSAIEAFHVFESTGKMPGTHEPILLEKYVQGKKWHGVTVEMCADSFENDRTLVSREIKENYPPWVANEIFSLAARMCQEKHGFVFSFIRNKEDFSENKTLPDDKRLILD